MSIKLDTDFGGMFQTRTAPDGKGLYHSGELHLAISGVTLWARSRVDPRIQVSSRARESTKRKHRLKCSEFAVCSTAPMSYDSVHIHSSESMGGTSTKSCRMGVPIDPVAQNGRITLTKSEKTGQACLPDVLSLLLELRWDSTVAIWMGRWSMWHLAK